MPDKFTNMLRRKLTVDWACEKGELDLSYHMLGIGGIHSMPPPKAVVEATAALKPKMVRIFLQEYFYIYKGNGVFDWSKLDAYMEGVHAMGGSIMASICIKPKALFPVLDERTYMPNNVKEWQDVIRALVLRYTKEKPYVSHWSVGNEMDQETGGGCPYYMETPEEFFEYYKITAQPIIEALPDVMVGGMSCCRGGPEGLAKYISRVITLCKENGVKIDFACFNGYSDEPSHHVASGRTVRNAIDKIDPSVKLYMTELNASLLGHSDVSLEESAYNPRRAASLAATLLDFNDDGCLDGSFQYHIYDQMNDMTDFENFYEYSRMMAEHWNDLPHRLGLMDLDGKVKPQYYLYKMIYSLSGKRAGLCGTDKVLRGLASKNCDGNLSVFLTNFTLRGTPDAVSQFFFKETPAGFYRMNVYRIDENTSAQMKSACACKHAFDMPLTESRIVYAPGDFHFDVYTPADSVTLVQFLKIERP